MLKNVKMKKKDILLKYVKMFGGFNFSFYLCNVKQKLNNY